MHSFSHVTDLGAILQVVQAVVAFDFVAQELGPGLVNSKLRGLQNPAPYERLVVIKAERALLRGGRSELRRADTPDLFCKRSRAAFYEGALSTNNLPTFEKTEVDEMRPSVTRKISLGMCRRTQWTS